MNPMRITRRHFVASVGIGGAGALLSACSRSGEVGLANVGDSPPSPFGQPTILTSSDGLLEVTLRAEATALPWRDATRYAYTYNGSSPGPTLRLKPGDRLVVNLENGMDDDTNLHTHGLHVPPGGNADNIFVRVPPGESRTYVYDIPSNHRSGLFWYHPHAHGTVAKQVAAGLAGAIVIVDGIEDIPEIAASTERIWVLSDPPITDQAGGLEAGAMEQMAGRQGDVILVNGIEHPNIVARAGTLERWRVVNASSSRYYRLALDEHRLHVIATDGGRLSVPAAVEEILLAPGERVELLITPASQGTYAVRSLAYDRGSTGMGGMMGGGSTTVDEVVLASLTINGNGPTADLPASLAEALDFSMPKPTANRVLELGMGMGGMMGGGGMMSFTIDGKTFDADRTDITVARGAVEEWQIKNTSQMDHPLHLHVWPFLVVDGSPSSGWKDTINVPAGESVSIIIPFTGIAGRTVYHCHILDHEDLGMMGVIDVTG